MPTVLLMCLETKTFARHHSHKFFHNSQPLWDFAFSSLLWARHLTYWTGRLLSQTLALLAYNVHNYSMSQHHHTSVLSSSHLLSADNECHSLKQNLKPMSIHQNINKPDRQWRSSSFQDWDIRPACSCLILSLIKTYYMFPVNHVRNGWTNHQNWWDKRYNWWDKCYLSHQLYS